MASPIRLDAYRLELAFERANEAVQQQKVPSAVLAIANRRELVRCEAYSRPGGDQVQTDSIFLLASISKPIAATAVMQLVEDGLLVLSDPLTRYIPEFAQPGKLPVTAWHLLTHTSGMEELAYWDALVPRGAPVSAFLEAARHSALHFAPGARYEYNTLSFYLLAELVTRLSGLPFEEYLRRRVLDPLGMVDTSFDPGSNERAVWAHGFGPDPQREAATLRHFVSLAVPGGGLWSTAADLVAFGQAYLNGGRHADYQLLAPATIELMTREHTTGLVDMVEGRPQPAHYGLGWGKASLGGRLPGSPRAFEHGGATGTCLWIDPEWDLVFVFLTNQFGVEDHVRQSALQAVYSALRKEPQGD